MNTAALLARLRPVHAAHVMDAEHHRLLSRAAKAEQNAVLGHSAAYRETRLLSAYAADLAQAIRRDLPQEFRAHAQVQRLIGDGG